MKVGLMDIDGGNFPNLALMKLSAYHKSKGDSVGWVNCGFIYDKVYKSKIFTYSNSSNIEFLVNSKEIIKGGTGYKLYDVVLSNEIEHITPDYSLYKYPYALGFLTRGCPNHCSWCIVPQKEGNIRAHADIDEFLDNRKIAILMDNNVLASEWGLKQIEKIIDRKIKVDFNQGLDSRLIAKNPDIAKLLGRVKWFNYLRMACDKTNDIEYVEKATKLLRKYNCTPKNYFVYLLVTKNINDAWKRARFLIKLGLKPFAQPYRDFNNKIQITQEQKDFARFINIRKISLNKIGIDWRDYQRTSKKWKEMLLDKSIKKLF